MKRALLEVVDLRTEFETDDGLAVPVDGVSFEVPEGTTVGLVGESGCGKTLTALSIVGLVPPPGKIAAGKVVLRKQNLLGMSARELRGVRGKDISMIFQEPMTSLNPVMRIGRQVLEALLYHEEVSAREAKARAIDMLRKVGIPEPSQRFYDYPHQLSGGMRQRAMVAMALVCRPGLVIADEPTTALDVTIQAQILELLGELQAELGMSVLLITHDLAVVAQLADEVVVMYAGSVIEKASAAELYRNAAHPYTEGLFKSLPGLHSREERLEVIPGTVPDPAAFPKGCKFRPRCARAFNRCWERPPLLEAATGHLAACWLVEGKGQAPAREAMKRGGE